MTASLCFGTIGANMNHVTAPAATSKCVTTLSLYCTGLDHHTSWTLILNTGVLQRCVLSSLFYSLFTYDCTPAHGSNTIDKFAEDATVFDFTRSIIKDRDLHMIIEGQGLRVREGQYMRTHSACQNLFQALRTQYID